MQNAKRSQASRQPKGKTPFSQPSLFAGALRTRTTTAPIAQNVRVIPRPQRVVSNGNTTVIEGDIEFANVSNSTTFTATRFELNPGLSSTFGTRVADISKGFEKYRFLKLQFSYIPAEAVTTTSGVVYLAAEYDPNDDAPSSLQSLSTYESQSNGRVYDRLDLSLKPAQMFSGVQYKKIRVGPVPGDLTVHDPGALVVATDSGANTNAIGKIWAHYRLELVSPQTDPATKTPRDIIVRNVSSTQALATGVAEAVNFDESIVSGFTVTNASGVYTVPPASYLIQGEVGFADSNAESFLCQLELLVDGASTVPPQSVVSNAASIAGGVEVLPFCFYGSLPSGGTIEVRAIATAAAGTLSLRADESRLIIRAV